MKNRISLWTCLVAVLLVMLLVGCGAADQEETSAPTAEATTESVPETTAEATTESTEATAESTEAAAEAAAVYTNPLTGEVLDAPYSGHQADQT